MSAAFDVALRLQGELDDLKRVLALLVMKFGDYTGVGYVLTIPTDEVFQLNGECSPRGPIALTTYTPDGLVVDVIP